MNFISYLFISFRLYLIYLNKAYYQNKKLTKIEILTTIDRDKVRVVIVTGNPGVFQGYLYPTPYPHQGSGFSVGRDKGS